MTEPVQELELEHRIAQFLNNASGTYQSPTMLAPKIVAIVREYDKEVANE